MKLGRTLILLWIASLALFSTAGIVSLVAPEWLSGIPGLTVRFFLGYCSIIVVAQALAAMDAIRTRRAGLAATQPVSTWPVPR